MRGDTGDVTVTKFNTKGKTFVAELIKKGFNNKKIMNSLLTNVHFDYHLQTLCIVGNVLPCSCKGVHKAFIWSNGKSACNFPSYVLKIPGLNNLIETERKNVKK